MLLTSKVHLLWVDTSRRKGAIGTLLVSTWGTRGPQLHYHSVTQTKCLIFFDTSINLARLRCTYKGVSFLDSLSHQGLVLAHLSKPGVALMLSSAGLGLLMKKTVACLRQTLLQVVLLEYIYEKWGTLKPRQEEFLIRRRRRRGIRRKLTMRAQAFICSKLDLLWFSLENNGTWFNFSLWLAFIQNVGSNKDQIQLVIDQY